MSGSTLVLVLAVIALFASSARVPALGMVIAVGVIGAGLWCLYDGLAAAWTHVDGRGLTGLAAEVAIIAGGLVTMVGAVWLWVANEARQRRS